MSWELRNSVGGHDNALLEAKTIDVSEFTGWVEVPPPEALATTAPTTIADRKNVLSRTMETDDCLIKLRLDLILTIIILWGCDEGIQST